MKKLLLSFILLASTAAQAQVYIEFEAKNAEGKVISQPALVVDEGNTGVVSLGSNSPDHTLKIQYKFTVIKEYADYADIRVEVSFNEEIINNTKSTRQATLSQEAELPYGETVEASLPNMDSDDTPLFVSFTIYPVKSNTMPQTAQNNPQPEIIAQENIQ